MWDCCSDTQFGAKNTLTFTTSTPGNAGDPGGQISLCASCPGNACKQYYFDITGIMNGNTAGCTAMNGRWVLTYNGACSWTSATFTFQGGPAFWQLAPDAANPGRWILSLQGTIFAWESAIPPPNWDCLSSLSLTNITSPQFGCTNLPATVTVRPLTCSNPIPPTSPTSSQSSVTAQAICTCAACIAGTYGAWSLDLTSFGLYPVTLSYIGGCTWGLVLDNGDWVLLQNVGGPTTAGGVWQLSVAVSAFFNGAPPDSLDVFGIGPCQCPQSSSSSSSSSSGSVSALSLSSSSSSTSAVPLVSNPCCVGVLTPATLYATISGTGCVDGTFTLIFVSDLSTVAGSFPAVPGWYNLSGSGACTFQMFLASQSGTCSFGVQENGVPTFGITDGVFGATLQCSPFLMTGTRGVLGPADSCGCLSQQLSSGTASFTITQ